jgi:DNA-binding MarR family transcriptional regulator
MQHNAAVGALAATMDAHCLGTRVGQLHRLVTREFEQALRPVGLTLPQLEILVALVVAGGVAKPALLAERLGLERSTISRNIALLHDRGWTAPGARSPSGRAMTVAITDEGVAAISAADQAWAAAQHTVAARLGPRAVATLNGWLANLRIPAVDPGPKG